MSRSHTVSASSVVVASSALLGCDRRERAGGSARGENEAATDAALMARIVAGDQAAFHCFAERHVVRFLAIAQRIIGNQSDAEEIVQDALLRVWLHAPEWQAGAARVTSWAYRIVVNLALDHLRKHRGRPLPLDDAGDPADPAPDAQLVAEGRQLESFMARAIAELPTRQRIALTLCYVEQLDCAEAAQIMQISVSAMESLLVRGRRTLRERLRRSTSPVRASREPWTCRPDWRRGQAIASPASRLAAASA
jgi:RNA polymerase sigma-70 factor (ECF subfamily)